MKHLRGGGSYILPNVSLITDNNSIMFNPLLILNPDTWYATYEITENEPFVLTYFDKKSLSVNGKQINFNHNTTTITCYASEINLAVDSDSGSLMGTAPSEYFVNNPSSFKLKPLDSNFYDENAYICLLFNAPEMGGVMGLPLPIMTALEEGFCTYNEEENSITVTDVFLQMIQNEMPYPFGAVLASISEETDEPTFYDTINESVSTPLRTITCLSNNFNVSYNDGKIKNTGVIPSEYFMPMCKTLTIKPVDNNISIEDVKLLTFIVEKNEYTVTNFDPSSGEFVYINENNSITINLLSWGYQYLNLTACFVLGNINEDNSVTIYDSLISTVNDYYNFETPGVYNLEFVMKNKEILPVFSYYVLISTIENKHLKSVTIPNNITNLNLSFNKCVSLESIIIPDSVTEITNSLFYGCTSLKNIKLSENITKLKDAASIDAGVFGRCHSLESIVLPKNINYVGSYSFHDCPSLTSIKCESTTAPELSSSETIFIGIPSTGTLYYPAGSDYSTWKEALPSGWTYVEF